MSIFSRLFSTTRKPVDYRVKSQAELEAAEPKLLPGDTVWFAPGTYQVKGTAPGVTYRSEDSDSMSIKTPLSSTIEAKS